MRGSRVRGEPAWRTRSRLPVVLAVFIFAAYLSSFACLKGNFSTSNRKIYSPPSARLNVTIKKLLAIREDEKFLWYAPHSGFGNQLVAFRNALKIAGILNRTLLIPPVFSHYDLAYGSCGSNKVMQPWDLRKRAMAVIFIKLWSPKSAYVSIADVIDTTVINSGLVRTLDFRLYFALHCGLDVSRSLRWCGWCQPLLAELRHHIRSNFDPFVTAKQRRERCALEMAAIDDNGQGFNITNFPVNEDCKSTLFTYTREKKGKLTAAVDPSRRGKGSCNVGSSKRSMVTTEDPDGLQAALDEKRNRSLPSLTPRNIQAYFGVKGSFPAETCVMSFGSMFMAYEFTPPTGNVQVDRICCATEYLPYHPKILEQGIRYANNSIRGEFACLHYRGGDSFYIKLRKASLKAAADNLKQLVPSRQGRTPSLFLMTDMGSQKWRWILWYTFFGFRVHFADRVAYLRRQVLPAVLWDSMGVYSNRLNWKERRAMLDEWGANSSLSNDWMGNLWHSWRGTGIYGMKEVSVEVFVEQVVCSCASLGFVPNNMSTISSGVLHMKRAQACSAGGYVPSTA